MTSAPSLPAPKAIAIPADFADWLSPILVKELRQGLKTRVFVATFIIVQIVMIVLMGLQLLALSNDEGSGTSGVFEAFFWLFVWAPLLLLMPARGLTAVSEETKANTLDLVQLTRLSAFRIVFGKWTALTAQTIMVVAAILPYAVLRYFFGSVDIVEDLKTIALLLTASLALTAGAIALSTAHIAVRIIVLVGGFMMFPVIGGLMTARRFGMGPSISGPFDLIGEWWFHLLTLPIYVYILLEIAAAKIAPLSENHSARKRVLALLLAIVLPVAAIFKYEDFLQAWLASFIPVWIWIVVEALVEKSSDVPSLYVPIVKRGMLGRLLGRLMLYPGWASGTIFTLLLFAVGIITMLIIGEHSTVPMKPGQAMAMGVFTIQFIAAVFTPVVLLLMMPRAKQRMWFYLLFQLLMGLIYLIASISADMPAGVRSTVYYWLAPLPTSTLLAMLQLSTDDALTATYLRYAVPVSVALMAYLLYRAVREFLRLRQFEKAAMLEVAQHTPAS